MSADGFELSGVIHLLRLGGGRASNLDALHAEILRVPDASLFVHTVQHRLRHSEAAEAPVDDLSTWVERVLRDPATAERIRFAVEHEGRSADDLRAALRDVLESAPAALRLLRIAPEHVAFQFLAADSVPVASGVRVEDGAALMDALEAADPTTWFYLLIEQAWVDGGRAPVVTWLESRGERSLARLLHESPAAERSMVGLRRRVLQRYRRSRLAHATLAAAGVAERERAARERATIAGLVQRIRGGGEAS